MTAPGAKSGPLTQADVQAIWEGTADSSYVGPLEAAGEGQGFEAYTQLFAQMARASAAVDTTTQALFILPWSGQSGPPASGAQQATVTLTVSRNPRAGYVQWPLVIAAGQVLFDEQTTDWGDQGSVTVLTGRRYVAAQTLAIPPGDEGPYQLQAQAEKPGYGYNNPLPGTIRVVDQPGTGYSNDRASMLVTPAGAPAPPPGQAAVATLVTADAPAMFLPNMVGQYVLMTSGANAGKVGRIKGFLPSNPPAAGTSALLAYDQAVEVGAVAGTFQAGEALQFKNGANLVATAILLGFAPAPSGNLRVVYELQTGTVALGNTLAGLTSTASATVSVILQALTWTQAVTPPNQPPGAGENWRVLDWANDLGVSVTNQLAPQGGKSPMLDGLGDERDLKRTLLEADDHYRVRLSQPNDVVSPNAIRRAITRSIGNALWCFREVGSPALPGFFYDRTGDPNGDFYDTGCLVFVQPGPIGVYQVQIRNGGMGYKQPVAVTFGSGTAAATAVTDANGTIIAVNITTIGLYTSAPTVTFAGAGNTGTGAVGVVVLGTFTGLPAFVPGEPVEWIDSAQVPIVTGLFGAFLPAATGALFVMVTRGLHVPTRPNLAVLPGDLVLGLQSGAALELGAGSSASVPASANAMRMHLLLAYSDFRAYFRVGVANLTDGEFGFAYDGPAHSLVHVGGFYDAISAKPGYFYDGYPIVARQKWLNVYAAVERARAGGVGWDMYRELIGCP